MSIYSERRPIPQREDYELSVVPGTVRALLGAPLHVEVKQGVFREVEVALMMDIEVARATRDWLIEKIQIMERLNAGQSPVSHGDASAGE